MKRNANRLIDWFKRYQQNQSKIEHKNIDSKYDDQPSISDSFSNSDSFNLGVSDKNKRQSMSLLSSQVDFTANPDELKFRLSLNNHQNLACTQNALTPKKPRKPSVQRRNKSSVIKNLKEPVVLVTQNAQKKTMKKRDNSLNPSLFQSQNKFDFIEPTQATSTFETVFSSTQNVPKNKIKQRDHSFNPSSLSNNNGMSFMEQTLANSSLSQISTLTSQKEKSNEIRIRQVEDSELIPLDKYPKDFWESLIDYKNIFKSDFEILS